MQDNPERPGAGERRDAVYAPLVTVITPVRNGARYLEACLQSVLTQGYPHIEHIFIDGGSTDGTLELLAGYQTGHPGRVRFISEPDRGAADAWNKGLRMARGEILGWLGADDVYEPDAVMTVVEFFRVNPGAYFVFGDCSYINEKGVVIGKFRTKDFDLNEAINDACYIPSPSAFYRREVLEKVGFMDAGLSACDLEYWIRAGKLFRLYRIKRPLSSFRVHKENVSGARGAGKMYALEGFVINRRYGGRLLSPRGIRYLVYRHRLTAWTVPILTPIWHIVKKLTGK